MSDLRIAPERDKSIVPAVLIALLVLAIVAAAVFYFNPHKVADITVQQTQIYSPHTVLGALKAEKSGGMRMVGPQAVSSRDDLYVVATVSVTDRLRLPIFLRAATAHVVFADGSQADSMMIPAGDVKRLQTIFPGIESMLGSPIEDAEQFDPGQTRVGTFVFGFAGQNANAWQQKRLASVTLELRNQEAQTAPMK